jgi:general L-amino acid transport system permease protein
MATGSVDRGPPARRLSWNDPRLRGIIYQIIAVAAVGALVWYLVHNTLTNLEARRIATGWGFLGREAGFAIGEGLISYTAADNYLRALTVGLLNTIRVAVIGIVLATIIGTLIGIARLSSNWLLAKFASLYVEVVRNVPLLLQLFVWYAVITETMPGPRDSLKPLPGFFISNRGIKFPVPPDAVAFDLAAGGLLLAIVIAIFVRMWARKRRDRTGLPFPTGWTTLALVIGLPILGWLIGGAPTNFSVPELRGFNFAGGGTLSPEFAALLLGLVIYTAGFIAEIVRSGILAVSKGQTEASLALGLSKAQTLRLIVLPQALRVIVPPMTNQYLNLTKNSSLAVAIGYPDIVSIANTTLNQTGQAIEGVAIIMLVFLTISLSIAAFMNWYNKHIALVER